MNIYVKDGKVLTEAPPEGSYVGVVKLLLSDAEAIAFLSNCLGYYAYAHHLFDEGRFVEQAIDVITVLECIAEKSGISHLFESYLNQEKEIRYGKES